MATTALPDTDAAASLYVGDVMHARLKPVGHRFSYRVMSLLIDLGRLDAADRQSPLFGVNRRALYSFHEADHGERDGSSLLAHVGRCAAEHNIDLTGGRVELLYAKPTGQKLIGGSEANGERLSLTFSGGPLERSEEKAARGRVAPEPNCDFGNAWKAAQQAGSAASAGTSLRYSWNDNQARSVWEVLDADGNVQRRLDGMSCSIVVR